MILALKMLAEFDSQPYIGNNPYHMGFGQPFFRKKPLLVHSGGVDKDQLIVKLDIPYKLWVQNVQFPQYGPMVMDQQAKDRMQETLKKDLNRALGSSNRTIDITMDSERINLTVQNWFNVGRQLAKFELKQIEPLEIVLAGLQNDYKTVEESLRIAGQHSNLFFSGIFKTTYGIGLVEVETSEKAANVAWLTDKVKKHKEADQEKLQKSAEINKYLPSLRKLVTWFDDVYAVVSKQGIMS
jgi:hypothetical protein